MGFRVKKINTTTQDFEQRKEKAISLLKDTELISTPMIKYHLTEKILREEFAFDDADKLYDKYDNVYFNGDFVIFPAEKLILV